MEKSSADSAVEIRHVSYAAILGDPGAADLLDEYSAECSLSEIGETNPQVQMYRAMEASGMMQAFGAYKGSELVGFATLLIYVLPHYGKKIATVESVFVARAQRSGVGNALMKAIEGHATQSACEVILYSAPVESRLEMLLTLLPAYRHTNSIFLRKLN